jgi:glycerol kinase
MLPPPEYRPAFRAVPAWIGLFNNADELCSNWAIDKTWTPEMEDRKRESMYQLWKKAVTRTFDWLDE